MINTFTSFPVFPQPLALPAASTTTTNKKELKLSGMPDASNPFDMNMQLSEHFKLIEFTRSATATKHNLENIPSMEAVERMRALCINVLEPLRRRFGVIRITSGFRTMQLNEYVGGVKNSQHVFGEAADIHVGSIELGRKMYNFIQKNLDYDQLLLEVKGKQKIIHCIHISYKSDRGSNRHISKMYYAM